MLALFGRSAHHDWSVLQRWIISPLDGHQEVRHYYAYDTQRRGQHHASTSRKFCISENHVPRSSFATRRVRRDAADGRPSLGDYYQPAHAFSWTNADGMVDLSTLGGTNSYASAVNSRGQVVGGSNVAGDGATHAVLWDRVH